MKRSVLMSLSKPIVDPAASADLAVILMQEGLAHLFLIGRRCVELLRHHKITNI
jgi:hypothetical protein